MEAFRGLNDDVYTALEGKADLATLAPVVLAIASTLRVVRTRQIQPVPWFNLLWFSLRSFIAFNADPHVGVPESPNEPQARQDFVH